MDCAQRLSYFCHSRHRPRVALRGTQPLSNMMYTCLVISIMIILIISILKLDDMFNDNTCFMKSIMTMKSKILMSVVPRIQLIHALRILSIQHAMYMFTHVSVRNKFLVPCAFLSPFLAVGHLLTTTMLVWLLRLFSHYPPTNTC